MPQDIAGCVWGGTPLKILTTFLYRYLSIARWPHRLPCPCSAAVCKLGMNESLLFDTLLSPAACCSYLRVDGNTIQSLFSLEQNSFDCVKSKLSVVGCLPVSYASKYFGWRYSIVEFGFSTLPRSGCALLPVPLDPDRTPPCWHPSNSQRQLTLSDRAFLIVVSKLNLGQLSEMGCSVFGFEKGHLCCRRVCVSSCISELVKDTRAVQASPTESLELSPNYFPLVIWSPTLSLAGCSG